MRFYGTGFDAFGVWSSRVQRYCEGNTLETVLFQRELGTILVVQTEADQEHEQVLAPLPNVSGVFLAEQFLGLLLRA